MYLVNGGITRAIPVAQAIFLIAMVMTVSGCGDKGASKTKSSQSIVRVNDEDITVHQINRELQRINVKPEQQEIAAKKLVQGLIDRQIVVQAAMKSKLDRAPAVVQAMEDAKAQILAQAYISDKVSKVSKPTEVEINEYRSKNVNVFSNRKFYLIDQITLPATAYSDALKNVADSAKTLEEVTAWLDKSNTQYARKKVAHRAESVPKALLDQLAVMSVGDILFIKAPEGIAIARLQEIKEAAISDKDATPIIERILMEEKRKLAAENEMKALRKEAKIEYIDKKYEMSAANAVPNVNAPWPDNLPGNATPNAADNNAKTISPPKKSYIEKGISGL